MEFYSSFGKRPVRLCEATRQFAHDSLQGIYGRKTMETPFVSLDHIEGLWDNPPILRYDIMVREICKSAPVRICSGERLSGSATLGDAIRHVVPAYHMEQVIFG